MFKERSREKELLDSPKIATEHLELNLRELHRINSWLGGYSTSLSALKRVLSPKRNAVVIDIGSGGGETVQQLYRWSLKHNYNLQIKAIDINPDCINYSTKKCGDVPGVQFICDDYRNFKYHVPVADVLHASLLCHHLSDEEIVELLRFGRQNGLTLVINDLIRHPVAYYSIKALTRLFSRSHMVKHDAPLSVLRGFTRSEWKVLINKAGVSNYSIRTRLMFRHEIIIWP